MTTTFQQLSLHGNEIQVGDEFPHLWFLHGPGVVKALRPYTGMLLRTLGESSQIATFVGSSMEMTLPAIEWNTILRRIDGPR